MFLQLISRLYEMMLQEDRIRYLANILRVVGADGKLANEEQAMLEKIRSEINAPNSELEGAAELALAPQFSPHTFERLSDTIRNLEDMLRMAWADGHFDEEEKPEILAFAKAAELPKDVVRRIVTQVRPKPPRKPEPPPREPEEAPPGEQEEALPREHEDSAPMEHEEAAPLESAGFCSQCGEKAEEGSRFCIHCGTSLAP